MAAVNLPAKSLIQATLGYVVDNQHCINTWLYENELAIPDWYGGRGQLFLDTFRNMWIGLITNCQSTLVGQYRVGVQPVYPTRFREISARPNLNGLVTGGMLPSTVAAVVSRYADQANRKAHGRIYVGGVPSVWNEKSQLSAAGVTAFRTMADEMDSVLNDDETDFTPVLCDYRESPNSRLQITVGIAQPVLRVQRRREVGRGI